ncbi:probable WRKY transcription factor 35 isoform X2 [Brachypodium distachyon]|uniref:WRKY domain-containing protein n=1 Tax=Brachypodium distachyon TaxID=15368 RepID=A0A0Q3JQQ3_BRADI|nr:probable WRKY transcription factor 35 isoform X2 [Brachypodium distachyon]KQK00881.1 hypothetical protein BRADI_3g52420v3 [Brachypodium distachyon]|eukprot:XP_003572849.1 probable WRKY transcription factor 35 isoform X2 [Brachypodium distachyon]
MCDYFLHRLEAGEQQPAGDLTDILRAGGAMPPVDAADLPSTATEWRLQSPTRLFAPTIQSSVASDGAGPSAFDPFSGLQDPFSSCSTDYPSSSGSAAADFFDALAHDAMDAKVGVGNYVEPAGATGGGAGGPLDMRNHHMMPIGPYATMGRGAVKLGGPMAAGQGLCPFDGVRGLQMSSSPRSAGGGTKRRKNQSRKVVCIPAPEAAVPGRTTGEVVPSDLWAWRKYGQKPIKGSPYPRGYYRCSSSKGCPARKQVERSRTDPNTLVITYTSEHNHPWPTQRNVLAGSTRSHYAKNSSNTTAAANSSKKNSSSRQQKPIIAKAEPRDHPQTAASSTTTTSAPPAAVKEEAAGDDTSAATLLDDHLLQQMFSQSCYRPMIPDQSQAGGGGHHDDFFADLTELDSDPVSLIFSAEYMETCRQGGEPDKEKQAVDNKDLQLDPFVLDWAPAG